MKKKYFFTALLLVMPLFMMSCKFKPESTSSISGANVNKCKKSGEGNNNDPSESDSEFIEAEDCNQRNDSVERAEKSGFTGSGYMVIDDEGSWIQWDQIMVPSRGKYLLRFSYLCEFESCDSDIIVNDDIGGVISFKSTGSGENWETAKQAVKLEQGSHKIRVVARTAGGLILDHMKIEPTESGSRGP